MFLKASSNCSHDWFNLQDIVVDLVSHYDSTQFFWLTHVKDLFLVFASRSQNLRDYFITMQMHRLLSILCDREAREKFETYTLKRIAVKIVVRLSLG